MRISNSPTDRLVIAVERRKSFSLGLHFVDSRNAPINLAGATLHLDVAAPALRPYEIPVRVIEAVASIPVPATGYARFDLQASDLDLTAKTYEFAVTLVAASGYSAVVAKGDFEVVSNPAASMSNVYTSANPGTSLDVKMLDANQVKLVLGSVLPPNAGYITDADKTKLDLLRVEDNSLVVDLSDYATDAEMAAGDAATLDAAHSYADGKAADALSSAQTYADGKAADALSSAQTYADGKAADALSSAQTYADSKVPTGTILLTACAAAPADFLLCDGSVQLRASYPALFSAIGTAFNTGGETSQQFRLPNLKGRVPVGQDSADASFAARGQTGGAKKVALTVAQLAAHTHVQNAHTHANTLTSATVASSSHSHTHVAPIAVSSGNLGVVHPADAVLDSAGTYVLNTVLQANTGVRWVGTAGVALMERYYVTSSGPSATTTVGISNASATAVNQSTGSGEAHENLQPYITLNYIIKT